MTEPTTTTQPTAAPTAAAAGKRFTIGVIYDVAKTLDAHGFGPFEGDHYRELMLHLFHFLYGGADNCHGRSAALIEATVPVSHDDRPTGVLPRDIDSAAVDEHRAEIARKASALRESGAAVKAALVRYDERSGMRR